MPVTFSPDEQRRWILVRAWGPITLADVLSLMRTARANVEHRMWPMLFDASGATTTATTADVEEAVAAVRQAVLAEGPRAHVALAADDDTVYARMLLYEAKCAEAGVRVIRVFRRLPDAKRWLEIVSAARHFQP